MSDPYLVVVVSGEGVSCATAAEETAAVQMLEICRGGAGIEQIAIFAPGWRGKIHDPIHCWSRDDRKAGT